VDPPQLHSDLWSWNEATGQMTITGLTGMTGITFTYKAVVDSYETRPILTQINFDPALNINPEVLTDPNDANKKSVNVNCLKLGNLTYPVYQFRLTNNPLDSCKEPHWHSFGNVYAIDVNDNTGRPDPNPPGCGHGISKDVPQLIFTIDLDTWEQFKIDHLPPL
jgi:hypothetical protein